MILLFSYVPKGDFKYLILGFSGERFKNLVNNVGIYLCI